MIASLSITIDGIVFITQSNFEISSESVSNFSAFAPITSPCLLADPSGRSFLRFDLYRRHDAFVFQFILWENALLCISRSSSRLCSMVFHLRKSFQTSMSSYFQRRFASRKIFTSLFSYLRRNVSYFTPRRRRLRCKAFYQKEQ